MNKNLLLGLSVLVAVFVVGAGLVYFGGSKPQMSPSPVVQTSPTASSMPTEEGMREVTVEGDEYEYNPGELMLTKGEKIKLTFVNKGKLPHNLMIDELGVSTDTIPGGKSTTVEFTVEKSGSFTAYCSVGNHRSLGMEEKVVVE